MVVPMVDAKTLKQWLDKGEAVLIDVRDPEEHRVENIPGSISLPLKKISVKTLQEIAQNKKVVVHCNAGRRGGQACEKVLIESTSFPIFSLEGGMNAWKKVNLPVQSLDQ